MERLLFKFYRSYFDVASELSDKDRLAFYDAIMNRQFNGIEPKLKGMSNFAYISQKHSIDSQVKGWEDKTCEKLTPTLPPMIPPMQGATLPPTLQLKEKEEEKEEEKEKEENKLFFAFDDFRKLYQGTKRGNETEFKNFQKHKDWKDVLPTLKNLLLSQIENRVLRQKSGQFVPEWKNLQTWINQRCWEEEIIFNPNTQPQFKQPQREIDKLYKSV